MERVSTKKALEMLGLTHRNSMRDRIKSGKLRPIVDKGRNYYDKAEVERLARGERTKAEEGKMLAIDAGFRVSKGFEHVTVEEWHENERMLQRMKQSAHLERIEDEG